MKKYTKIITAGLGAAVVGCVSFYILKNNQARSIAEEEDDFEDFDKENANSDREYITIDISYDKDAADSETEGTEEAENNSEATDATEVNDTVKTAGAKKEKTK